MSIVMIGLDTAKASFQVHGSNQEGRAEIRRKLRRSEVIGFFEVQPACTVVLEACGSAHPLRRQGRRSLCDRIGSAAADGAAC
jgi:transposase